MPDTEFRTKYPTWTLRLYVKHRSSILAVRMFLAKMHGLELPLLALMLAVFLLTSLPDILTSMQAASAEEIRFSILWVLIVCPAYYLGCSMVLQSWRCTKQIISDQGSYVSFARGYIVLLARALFIGAWYFFVPVMGEALSIKTEGFISTLVIPSFWIGFMLAAFAVVVISFAQAGVATPRRKPRPAKA